MQQLTLKHQAWLEHINQVSLQNVSMSSYVKQNNLSIKVV